MSCLGSGDSASVPTGMLRALLDRRGDLGAGQAAALAGLGALVDLDLDVAHAAQVGAGDAEVAAGRLQALPAHVGVGGQPQRAALARRGHGQPGRALDAGDQVVLGGRPERGRGVADGPVPDRLAHAEAAHHEAAARVAAHASRRRRPRRAARWPACRWPPDPSVGEPARSGAATLAPAELVSVSRPAPSTARSHSDASPSSALLERMPAAQARLEAAALVGLQADERGGPRRGMQRHAGAGRHGARPQEAARHGQREVVEQRRVAPQALERPGHATRATAAARRGRASTRRGRRPRRSRRGAGSSPAAMR